MTSEKFIVNCQGLSLPLPRRQAVECEIGRRSISIAGSVSELHRAFDEPDRKFSPKAKFNLIFNQAVYEALNALGVERMCWKELRPVPRFERGVE